MDFLRRHRTALLWTLAYAALVAGVSCFHEVWRDEVRALSIASGSPSIPALFASLRDEGHPCLWYLLLYAGWHLTKSVLVLKAASILAAAAAAFLWLDAAPFPLPARLLFLAGYFPVYEYSVVSRSYGLGMALLFLLCTLYPRRRKRMPAVGAVLLLLANTSAYALVLAGAFFLSLAAEAVGDKDRRDAKTLLGLGLAAAGVALSLVQVWPDRATVFDGVFHPRWLSAAGAVLAGLLHPGAPFHNAVFFDAVPGFQVLTSAALTALVWAFAWQLRRKPRLLVVLAASLAGWAVIHRVAYGGMFLRHQGFLVLLAAALLWLDAAEGEPVPPAKGKVLLSLLLVQALAGGIAGGRDVLMDYSSSARLGRLLKDRPELRDAAILAEPGVLLESVPYYAPNPTYLAREGRFGRTVSFTSRSRRTLSLGELLAAARGVRDGSGRPVLILLELRLDSRGPFSQQRQTDLFIGSLQEVRDFTASTRMLASFRSAFYAENFDVFQLTDGPGGPLTPAGSPSKIGLSHRGDRGDR